jgi:hypothetical protein
LIFVYVKIILLVVENYEYLHNEDTHGCCISDGSFHQRCHCKTDDENLCNTLCTNDNNCKGYVEYKKAEFVKITNETHESIRTADTTDIPKKMISQYHCQLSTTSTCPESCRFQTDFGNVGILSKHSTCGRNYGGWYIKIDDSKFSRGK